MAVLNRTLTAKGQEMSRDQKLCLREEHVPRPQASRTAAVQPRFRQTLRIYLRIVQAHKWHAAHLAASQNLPSLHDKNSANPDADPGVSEHRYCRDKLKTVFSCGADAEHLLTLL